MDYLPHLRRGLTEPLIRDGQEGIPRVMEVLTEYDLLREDLDNIMEVTQWSEKPDPMKAINPKVSHRPTTQGPCACDTV